MESIFKASCDLQDAYRYEINDTKEYTDIKLYKDENDDNRYICCRLRKKPFNGIGNKDTYNSDTEMYKKLISENILIDYKMNIDNPNSYVNKARLISRMLSEGILGDDKFVNKTYRNIIFVRKKDKQKYIIYKIIRSNSNIVKITEKNIDEINESKLIPFDINTINGFTIPHNDIVEDNIIAEAFKCNKCGDDSIIERQIINCAEHYDNMITVIEYDNGKKIENIGYLTDDEPSGKISVCGILVDKYDMIFHKISSSSIKINSNEDDGDNDIEKYDLYNITIKNGIPFLIYWTYRVVDIVLEKYEVNETPGAIALLPDNAEKYKNEYPHNVVVTHGDVKIIHPHLSATENNIAPNVFLFSCCLGNSYESIKVYNNYDKEKFKNTIISWASLPNIDGAYAREYWIMLMNRIIKKSKGGD